MSEHELRMLKKLRQRLSLFKGDLRKRHAGSRKLLGEKFFLADLHSHSTFSDGAGSVPENAAAAFHAGLDFIFATDHKSRKQKRPASKIKNVSWGQEPGAGPHHICLLENSKLFKPGGKSLAEDFDAARKISPFVFIPHPAGWYPGTYYSDSRIKTLWTLGNSFAVEVLNGACKIFSAYDQFDRHAVRIWDRLLCEGFMVTPLGNSDAHEPEGFGTAWTGVYAARCSSHSIIKALKEGRCFAGEGPMLSFKCKNRLMGSELRARKGETLRFKCRVADIEGLAYVSLVSGGRVLKRFDLKGDTLFSADIECKVAAGKSYFRLESVASDNRRSFSGPIYIETAQGGQRPQPKTLAAVESQKSQVKVKTP